MIYLLGLVARAGVWAHDPLNLQLDVGTMWKVSEMGYQVVFKNQVVGV